MNDPREPPPARAGETPRGPALYGWFDGIMEGPRFDDEVIGRLADAINYQALVPADLELDGGRFSILLADRSTSGDAIGPARQERFLRFLQGFIQGLPDDVAVESTLRCTLVFEDRVVESLFAVVDRQLRCVSGVRAVTELDRRRDPEGPPSAVRQSVNALGRRGLLAVGALLAIGLGFLAWGWGLVDRALSTDSAELTIHTGVFDRLLDVEIQDRWGNYEVTLHRGPDYPKTSDDVTVLLAGTQTPAGRAAVTAVANGLTVYLRLENQTGLVLASRGVELRALLVDEDGVIVLELPGRMSSRLLRVALDSGAGGR